MAFTYLDASDGEKVAIYHGEFRTADEANRYFDWYLKKRPAHVIKQEDRVGPDGKIVGRRAEFLLTSEGKVKTWAVMWTDGVHCIEVTAPSLECAQEVERQSKK